MARYRGPKSKIARKFNEPIFGPSKALQKKAYGPGQHGRGRRKKQSEYAIQLMEKQKEVQKQIEQLAAFGTHATPQDIAIAFVERNHAFARDDRFDNAQGMLGTREQLSCLVAQSA